MLVLILVLCDFMARRSILPVDEAIRNQQQFIADASHELKTPLTVMLANLDIMAASPDATIRESAKWVENTKQEAGRMSKLVNEMLFLARSDAAMDMHYNFRLIDLAEVANEVTLAAEALAFERNIRLETDIRSPAQVVGDAERLKQVIMILGENAAKYVDEGGTVRLTVNDTSHRTVLLTVFIAGCGKTPDQELTEKVPASANGLCLIDGNSIVLTKLYKDHRADILKELKEASLPEDILQCRMLIFGSTKEEWGGALMQSAGGQVRKIYDKLLAESKKDKSCKDLKETVEGGQHKITGVTDGKKVLAILYHDNLLLIAIGKDDPAFFRAKPVNPLLKEIALKETLVSAAVKVELPPAGQNKDVDTAVQMVPSLKKLRSVAVSVPFSEDKPERDFRAVFQDDAAANEMLAAINLGLGVLTQSGDKDAVDLVNMFSRKVEKKSVRISFPISDLARKIDEMQKRSAAKADRASKRMNSVSNLKQIAVACKTFAIGHKGKFPDELTDLVKGECLTDPKVFISPFDSRRKASGDKVVRPSNTSYAYVGKGLSEKAAAGLPLAFEKPDVVVGNAGTCSVLYVGGRVLNRKVKGRTCEAIARELTAKSAQTDSKEVAVILANAAAADRAE